MPRLTYEQRLAHPRIMGNRSRGRSTTTAVVAEIQGANAVIEHLYGAASVFPDFLVQVLDVSADIGIDEARKLVRVDTGATRDSINKEPGVWAKPERGEFSIRYGPTTFYAPFLEYGTVHAQAYPFMIPSADVVQPLFYGAVMAFVDYITTGRISGASGIKSRVLSQPGPSRAITSMRSFLYTGSKFLGDIAIFTQPRAFGPSRAMMLGMARALGDISSVMTSTIGSRVTHRLSGRVSGRIIGFGSRSLSHSESYSAFVGGASGHRIYQRAVGRYTNLGLSSNNLPGNVGF